MSKKTLGLITLTTRQILRTTYFVSVMLSKRMAKVLQSSVLDDEDEDMASSTQIVPPVATGEGSVKLQLAKALQALPCSQSKNTAAFKRVPWKKLEIAGCSIEDLQQHFKEIMKMTSNIRTLGEILADFEQNESKYTARCHPDFPSRPSASHLKYISECRDDIEKALEKKYPGKKVAFVSALTSCYA